MPRRARSRSALGVTTQALLPPSSSSARPKRPAITGAISRPIRTDPVADTSATRGSSTRRRPPTRSPSTRWWTPAGAPTSSAARASRASVARARQQRRLGRLPDHGVAGHQGERGVPGVDRDREVEGGDDADHAQRVPGLHQPVARPLRGHGLAEQLARLTDGEVGDVDHLLHLAERLGGDLADLGGDQRGQILLVLGQQLAPALDQLAAHRCRHLPPGGERLGRPRRSRRRRPRSVWRRTEKITSPVIGVRTSASPATASVSTPVALRARRTSAVISAVVGKSVLMGTSSDLW